MKCPCPRRIAEMGRQLVLVVEAVRGPGLVELLDQLGRLRDLASRLHSEAVRGPIGPAEFRDREALIDFIL